MAPQNTRHHGETVTNDVGSPRDLKICRRRETSSEKFEPRTAVPRWRNSSARWATAWRPNQNPKDGPRMAMIKLESMGGENYAQSKCNSAHQP